MDEVTQPATLASLSERSGIQFEALFYKQLQQVTARIHETEILNRSCWRRARISAGCSMQIA